MGHCKTWGNGGTVKYSKNNKFNTITLAQVNRLSFSYNISAKLIDAGLVLTSGNYDNLPGCNAA